MMKRKISDHDIMPDVATITAAPITTADGTGILLYQFFALCQKCQDPIVSEDYFKTWDHVLRSG